MSMRDFSGNKGEWSEPYVVLKLLADGRLSQADKDMLPSADDFSNVLEVIRGDTAGSLSDDGAVVFTFVDAHGQQHNLHTNQTRLALQASRLFKSICAIREKKGAFELKQEEGDLKFLGFRRLTNPAPKSLKTTKRDLNLRLKSPKTGVATLGFSVKSEIGAPPTLLNASEPTNIIYRVRGLTKAKIDAINAMSGPRKIMDRCRAILQNAESIEYEAYHSSIFADNLEVVDSALPKMLADLVKVHYFQQILAPRNSKKLGVFRESDKLSSAVELLSKSEPYASKCRKNFCEIKVKRFLRSCALGMMPSEEWNGKDDASGGYIVVLPDGRLVALYVYNTNLFEKYLYESTIFERASTTRHNYMRLYSDGETGDCFLKLNLQIRFNR